MTELSRTIRLKTKLLFPEKPTDSVKGFLNRQVYAKAAQEYQGEMPQKFSYNHKKNRQLAKQI